MAPFTLHAKSSNRQRDLFLQCTAWAGVVGPILFVLVFTLDGFLQPGYSSLSQMISWLALRSNGWVQNANFIVFGLLLVFFAFGFSERMQSVISQKWLKACTVLLLISGAGWANDGIFVSDAPGDPVLTIHGMMHDIGFLVIFSLLIITFFLVGRQLLKATAWRTYGWYSIISGCVTLGLLFLLIYVGIHASQLTGLVNRFLIIEAIAWYVVMGCSFLAREQVNKEK